MAQDGTAFHGVRPLAVLDDVINAFNDCTPTNRRHPPSGLGSAHPFCSVCSCTDVCDTADAIELALKEEPALAGKHREIQQASRTPQPIRTTALPARIH